VRLLFWVFIFVDDTGFLSCPSLLQVRPTRNFTNFKHMECERKHIIICVNDDMETLGTRYLSYPYDLGFRVFLNPKPYAK
jgi:hypothetical protein